MRFAAQPWIVLEAAIGGTLRTFFIRGRETPKDNAQDTVASKPAQTQTVESKPTVSPVATSEASKTAVAAAGGDFAAGPSQEQKTGEPALLSEIKSGWDQILEEIKTKGPALEAVWRYGQPQALQGNVLQVAFEAEGIKNVATGPDKIAALEEALQKILKAELKVRPGTVSDLAVSTNKTDIGPSTEEPPGIVEARTLFGADKVSIREEREE